MVATKEATGKTRLEITLVPVPQSAEIARMFVRHQLLSLGHDESIEDAGQITGELVGNAVEAIGRTARGDRRMQASIRLRLGPYGGRMLLEVWDPAPGLPVLREPDPLAESGRGLHIVRSLAARLGWCPDQDKGGKTVWAVFR